MLEASMAPSAAQRDQSMQLVDEQNDLPLESSISLSTALSRSSNSPRYFAPASIGAQVERDHTPVLQNFGDVAGNNPLCQASTIAVLPTPGSPISTGLFLVRRDKHLHHPSDLFVPPNDGVKLSAPRLLGQIAGITLQRLILGFRILIRNSLRSAHRGQRLQDRVMTRSMSGENFLRRIFLRLGGGKQKVLVWKRIRP